MLKGSKKGRRKKGVGVDLEGITSPTWVPENYDTQVCMYAYMKVSVWRMREGGIALRVAWLFVGLLAEVRKSAGWDEMDWTGLD